jgi:hypothetical protein
MLVVGRCTRRFLGRLDEYVERLEQQLHHGHGLW